MPNLDQVILGTAQLTREYGAERLNTRQTLFTSPSIVLDRSFEIGIRSLDTAPVYGDAELAVSNHSNLNSIAIQTKWSFGNGPVVHQLESSMRRLNSSAIWSYLLHTSVLNAGNGLSEELMTLESALSEGRLEKVGFSVYSLDELDAILELGLRNGVIQLPFNPLMKGLLESRQVDQLVELGFEIQVRSVFMQGMLTANSELRNSFKLPSIELARLAVKALSLELKVSANALLVEYASRSKHSPRVVVGVSDHAELDLLVPVIPISAEEIVMELDRALAKIELSTFEANPMNWSTSLN
jgi:aryl-alcohol dehydrogenase-like predicted oxidoreductase